MRKWAAAFGACSVALVSAGHSRSSPTPEAGPSANPSSGCRTVSIALDEPGPDGFTPNDALTALHAAEQRFVLYEEHLQFFETVGLGTRPAGHDEVVFRFQPTHASYTAGCPPGVQVPAARSGGHGPSGRMTIAGTVTATLSRGATYTAKGDLYFELDGKLPTRASFNADTMAGPDTRLQVVWDLSSRAPMAILNAFRSGHTRWRLPLDEAEDAAIDTTRLGKFRQALTALSGRPMKCTTTCSGGTDTPYSGPAPTVAVPGLGGRLLGGVGSGRITVEIRWPGDPRPIGLSHPIEGAADPAAQQGYRVVGYGSRDSVLPAKLSKWAGCPKDEAGGWELFLEAQPDAQGNLVGHAVVTWEPRSGRVRCEF